MADAFPNKPAPRKFAFKAILLLFLLAIIAAALYGLFFTHWGARIRDNPHEVGREFREWVDAHDITATSVFLGLYILASVSLLPVWWLQILAGAAFGLWWGIAWSLVGATLGALATFFISQELLADWVRTKFEARHARLRELDEKMGHNGLMIVMAARLTHVIPFGVSNYLFGLSRINWVEVAIGTLLGNGPAISMYVAMGAGHKPWHDWRFMTGLAIANILLLIPIAVRYWRPKVFKKIGVE